jgi:hypothetical protein
MPERCTVCIIRLIASGVPGAPPSSNTVQYPDIPDPSKVRFRPPHDTRHTNYLRACNSPCLSIPWRGNVVNVSSDFSQTPGSWGFFWPNVIRCLIKCVWFLGQTSWGLLSGFMANDIGFLGQISSSYYVPNVIDTHTAHITTRSGPSLCARHARPAPRRKIDTWDT